MRKRHHTDVRRLDEVREALRKGGLKKPEKFPVFLPSCLLRYEELE